LGPDEIAPTGLEIAQLYSSRQNRILIPMPTKTSKIKTKRPPKGQRTYARRVKQAARKDANITNPQHTPMKPARAPKKKDES
jgi:hypothetical protein